jgi:hypothetical protein
MARRSGSFQHLVSYNITCPGMASHFYGTSLQSPRQGSTKHHFKTPRRLDLLSSYKKGEAGASQRASKRQEEKTTTNEQLATYITEINISSNHPVLFLFLLWDLGSTPSLASL